MERGKQIELFRAKYRDRVRILISKTIEEFKKYPENPEEMQLTIASNDDLSVMTWQFGDNSFMGPCYHYPHWGVIDLCLDTDVEKATDEIMDDLFDQYFD